MLPAHVEPVLKHLHRAKAGLRSQGAVQLPVQISRLSVEVAVNRLVTVLQLVRVAERLQSVGPHLQPYLAIDSVALRPVGQVVSPFGDLRLI